MADQNGGAGRMQIDEFKRNGCKSLEDINKLKTSFNIIDEQCERVFTNSLIYSNDELYFGLESHMEALKEEMRYVQEMLAKMND